jgi:hypothetical protein
MEAEFKPEEKELIRLVNYFRKRGEILIIENKLGDEYKQMLETCDKFVEQLEKHAVIRQSVIDEREQLNNVVKDNAKCPECESNAHLKVIGTDTNEKGWKSNKYKCRKCNITFVWNAPNNPWDMIPYVEHFIGELEKKLATVPPDTQSQLATTAAIEQMKDNLSKLKPVVENSERNFRELEEREGQMAELVHKFKKHLMIEKIRLED